MPTLPRCLRSAALAASLLAFCGSTSFGQAVTKAQTKKAAASASPEPAVSASPEPAARRLPPGYGQLGLTDEQREKIYAVQEKHAAELAKLNQQIVELRAKITAESEAVLTPAQKTRLDRNRAEAKAKSKSKAAAKEDPKAKAKSKN